MFPCGLGPILDEKMTKSNAILEQVDRVIFPNLLSKKLDLAFFNQELAFSTLAQLGYFLHLLLVKLWSFIRCFCCGQGRYVG